MAKNTKPTKDEIVKGKIANALTSAAKNHIVATTDDIYDTNFLEYQNEINERFSTNIEVVKEKVEILETDVDAIELDISSLKKHVSDIDESLESVQGEVDGLQNKVSGIDTRIKTVEGKVSTIQGEVSGIDARIKTVEGDVSTIQGEVSRVDTRLETVEGEVSTIQGEVSGIDSKIPEEASSSNQLADKQYVLNLVHGTSSSFRGNWNTWVGVPTDSEEYPEDGEGNRMPRQGDYIVIVDASEYIGEDTGKTYDGSWRFVYDGDWETNNKDGWKPEYQINEKPELTIHFRKKKEGDNTSTLITDVKVSDKNTLLRYPELDYSEFVNGGYWDTNITDLRNISASTVVYYITPFMTSGDNRILLKICYEKGWSSSPDYITLNEVHSITDEMVAEAAKKLTVIEDENGNIITVFDSIIFEEDEETNIVMASYSLFDGLCWDKNGNEYNIRNCFCYSKDGVRYNFSDVHYGNCFYKLESWTELPEFTGITSLGDGETYRVFLDYSKIREINLENITSLPVYTLFRCIHLENIYIPSVLINIETYAIASCDSLQSLVVDVDNPKYTSRDSNGNECNCIVEKPVTTRGTRSAINNQLTLIQGCNVSTLPDNIKHIASGAFDECTRLASVTLPNGLLTIGDNVFRGCTALSGNIIVPETLESIGESTFRSCAALGGVNINVPVIPNCLFKDCTSLSSVTLGNGVTEIGNQAFMNDTSLTAITISDSVTKIGTSAFANCDLRNINTNNIAIIASNAFANNIHLSSVTITDNTVNIGNEAFGNCNNLETVTIGNGITELNRTFVNCHNLETVDLSENESKITNNTDAFVGCENLSSIIVPDELITEYRESQDWYEYREMIFGSSVYTITFDSMGGETTPSTQNIRYCAYIENPGTVHKDLYIFEYWEDEDGNKWNFEESYVVGDMTLYAHYREVKAIMVKSISNDVTNISMSYKGNYPASVEYSYDGLNWYNIWNNNYLTISLSEGYSDYVYFRGYNPGGFSRGGSDYSLFNINNGQCDLLGNIMYLKNYNEELDYVNYYEFRYLFQNCHAIVNVNDFVLPATTLAPYCYSGMFWGCTSLTAAPELPATTLADYCYYSMFQGCNNLNYIKCLATNISANNCTTNWISGVSNSGTFVKYPATTSWTTGVNGMPVNWNVEDAKPENYITFTALENNVPISLNRISSNQKLWYSTDDGETWNNFTTGMTITLGNSGDTCYIAGILSTDNTDSNYTQFNLPNKVSVSGNINSLWDGYASVNTLHKYCGYSLFSGCTGLVNAGESTLGASTTKLADGCYENMFKECTSLITTPELPATTLANSCYSSMFQGCSRLTTAPELFATTLVGNCYSYMFYGCSSLANAPKLPATTLANSCYSHMFQGCTSLTTAPELPATTLANTCYGSMFRGCSSLNYIKCLATDISTSLCTGAWVDGVASSGTFVKAANMTGWTTGVNGIPTRWVVEDAVTE